MTLKYSVQSQISMSRKDYVSLKNEWQDRITSVVQCLICKTVLGTDKFEARDMTKTDIFVSHQTTTQLFVSRTSCLKYQNNISFGKNRIKKIIQCDKNLSCTVLSCVVLFCLSTYCFANQTHLKYYNK